MKSLKRLEVDIATTVPSADTGGAIAICVFEGDSPSPGSGLEGLFASDLIGDEFKAEPETSTQIHTKDNDGNVRRVFLIGCGLYSELTPGVLRRSAGMAVREASVSEAKHLHFQLPNCDDQTGMTLAAIEGAVLGSYNGGFYKNDEDDQGQLERLTLIVSDASAAVLEAANRGRIIAEATNWTRMLADTPGRDLPPQEFARQAAQMAEEFGLIVESLNVEQVRELGMGGLLGVGKGSDQPPALIVIRYEPEGTTPTDELWAFVGKGITFDTGGISLKHGLDMYEMKTDMAGGAAVVGALRAIAQLKPKQRIVGIVPSAENMPSGRAIKPGDVITTFAGHTIEVVDTDAEGRLVLVDGIAFAKHLGASRIVDLATLTGSIIVALGDHRTGLFSNNDVWATEVIAAAEKVDEPVWRMPVNEDYKKRIESDIADFKNYGGRPDATGAALLLSKFAKDTPWVHLDIAGTSWYDDALPFAPKGSSGTGVRTLVELVCNRFGDK